VPFKPLLSVVGATSTWGTTASLYNGEGVWGSPLSPDDVWELDSCAVASK